MDEQAQFNLLVVNQLRQKLSDTDLALMEANARVAILEALLEQATTPDA